MYNAATLAVSFIALALSGFATLRQTRHARSTSDMTLVLEVALRNIRDKEFQNDQRYVLTELARDHPPNGGMDALPEPARSMTRNVACTYPRAKSPEETLRSYGLRSVRGFVPDA
ncbi:hypothetical protein [Streptomyces lincolnensis]|uniref:hypothetical protein n=1 Tax=Streptomyces lincolnensis TaxID=1915 RepID=UPI0037D20296